MPIPQPQEELSWTQIANRLEFLISRMSHESRGAWEWGFSGHKSDEQHVADFAESLSMTREHFGIRSEAQIHGVYVGGGDLKLAITGTSPTAAARAEYLAALSPKNIAAIIAYIREKEGNNGK